MSRIFFDLETQRLSEEVEGGWANIRDFGLSVAVTWDEKQGFRSWFEGEASELVEELAQFAKIIGFNLLEFDYKVLGAYVPDVGKLLSERTFDILADLRKRLGHRVSLSELALYSLGEGKLGSGFDAVRWFRQGRISKTVEHCRMDVELTKKIFEYGQKQGVVYYRGGSVRVDWEDVYQR